MPADSRPSRRPRPAGSPGASLKTRAGERLRVLGQGIAVQKVQCLRGYRRDAAPRAIRLHHRLVERLEQGQRPRPADREVDRPPPARGGRLARRPRRRPGPRAARAGRTSGAFKVPEVASIASRSGSASSRRIRCRQSSRFSGSTCFALACAGAVASTGWPGGRLTK